MRNYGGVSHEGTWRYVTCAVATATYRVKVVIHQEKPEPSILELDSAALRESLATRLSGLPEKPDANS